MNIKAWSTALLILCLCPAAIAQKANRYLEKPLPQGWGRDVSHAIPGDDNLFSEQIPPIDDKWWKAFDDPMLDSLITVASTQNYSVLSAMDRMDMAKAKPADRTRRLFPFHLIGRRMGAAAKQRQCQRTSAIHYRCIQRLAQRQLGAGRIRKYPPTGKGAAGNLHGKQGGIHLRHGIPLCQIASAYIGLRELQQELSVVTHNCHTQQPYSTSPKYATKPDWYPSWMSRKPNPCFTVPKPPSRNWRQASTNTSQRSQSYSVLIPNISAPYWKNRVNCPTTWNL